MVPPGASAEAIARQLHAMGLVRHPLVFRLLARQHGVSGKLKAGEYALTGPLSVEGILDALVRGDVVRRDLTVPEGRSLDEIAQLAVAEGLSLEAFLRSPATPRRSATSTRWPRASRATCSPTPTTCRSRPRRRARWCGTCSSASAP